VVYGGLSPAAGFLADRFGRSRVIIFSLFAWSATTWLTAHATTLGELLASRAIMGISEACYFPAAAALLMDYHRGGTRSLANGIHLSGVMVGSGMGGLGGLIAEKYGWAQAFEIFGAGGVVYTLVLMIFLRDRPRDATEAGLVAKLDLPVKVGDALRSLFSRGSFVLALVFWGLLGLASWSFIGWLPSYLSEHFHLPQGKAGLIATGYTYTGSMIGMVLSGYLADRWAVVHPRGRIFVGVIGLCLAVPGILMVSNTGRLPFVIFGLLLYGLMRSFPDANMMPILCQITDPRYRATGYGLLNAFATIVGGTTIYIGGVLRDAKIDVSHVFDFGAGSLLVCAALLWFIKPRLLPSPTTLP
jgi:MFS family permease